MPITQDTIENIKNFKNLVLRKQYAYLFRHPQIKKVFFAVETADKIREIGQKYHFSQEKITCLAKITGKILLSEISVKQFSESLKQSCGLADASVAQDIAQEAYQAIIKPIEGYLTTNIKQELANHGIEIKPNKISNF